MKNFTLTWKDSLTSLGVLAAAFVLCLLLHNLPISEGLAGMILVLAVFLISDVTEGYIYGVAASFLAVLIDNFAFTFVKAHGGEIWGGNRKTGGAEVCFGLEMEEEADEQQQIQNSGHSRRRKYPQLDRYNPGDQ